MKKIILTVATAIALASCGGQSNSVQVEESFKVYGNCGMCEKTIESSLKDVKGVSKADWDKTSKKMIVSFDSSAIDLATIKQKIADVGYDMDDVRASETVYGKLPDCCQYDRPEE